jgi:flagellar hook protein FlgE
MDVLGNNIANVNTTSFKSQSITFSDLMYQTTQTASGATATKGGVNARQIGLGAKSGAIATAIESQGATQTTNNPFDIMITGKSFFVVNNGKENLYTRDGSFYVDGAGNLAMQSNGYLVQGWVAQEDKETGEIKINRNGGLSSLQIMSAGNSTYSPASTTQALYSGNIDDNDTNVTSDDGKTITLEFYDNKGYLYTGKFTLKDTGMDHLFAIELTDIIDSSGQSIGSSLLEHVTFGTPESKEAKAITKSFESAYRVSGNTTNNTAEIYLQPGAVEFSKVNLSGYLSDLMTTSTTSGKNVLNDVYGIKDSQVIGTSTKYDKDSAYTIDKDTGVITVSYNVVDDQKTKNSNFLYTSSASSDYYYDQTTGKGYKVPNNFTNKKATGLSKYESTALTNVFKNTLTGAALTLDATHTYSFDGTKVTATNITGLTQQSMAAKIGHDDILGYADDFDASSGYGDMEAALQYTKDDGSIGLYDPVFYSFDGEGLKIYNADYSDIYVTTEKLQLTANTYTVNNTYTPVTNLESALDANDLALLESKYPSYANDFDYYTLRQETGSFAIQFYKYDPTASVKAGSTTLWDGKIKSQNFEPNVTNFVQIESSKISDAFTNANQGYDYIALNENTKVADYPQDFLKTVFGVTDSTISTYSDSNVSFLSNGAIVISHDETTPLSISGTSGYGAQYNSTTGAMDYVTTVEKKVDKWTLSSKQMSGNISDLKEVAEGDLAHLLKAVYGYDDEMADAFGSDGTYVIDPATGSIKLTTGKNSIQLLFDPSTGAIKSANGNEDDIKVNLIFDQSIDGLEAFGYQVGNSGDPEEIAKKGTVGIDFSTVTNYNTQGASTIKAVKGDKKSLNTGRAVGEMNGVNVSTDGQIFATYSNGQTKLLGQIASAEFANASGLSKEGDNLYASTLNSGEATIQDITTDGGYMNTGVLEMSNVDLSREFTEMITTQRGFQANSRIITVSDTLLEELTNLKR